MYSLHKQDAIEFLKTLEDASVDLIVTDPPYSSLEKHRAVGTTTRLKKKWFSVVPNDYFILFMTECFRVLKKNSHCYIFCDEETADYLKPVGKAAGFTFWKSLIWHKLGRLGMGYHWRNQTENILFFEKGKLKLNDLSLTNLLSFKSVYRKDSYPTEKPVELLEVLIQQSSQTGYLVCDPFFGSGAVAVAALNNKRNFIGNDLSDIAHTYILNRPDFKLLINDSPDTNQSTETSQVP